MPKKMIAAALSIGVAGAILLDGYYTFFVRNKSTQSTVADSNTNRTAQSNNTQQTDNQGDTASSSASSTASSGQYKDGTYTGDAVSTQWGDVQVQIKVANGKIATVNVLEYPDDNDRDQQINSAALPTYKKEALSEQSSQINQISGATETYKGFTGSLQDAIDQAEVS